MKHFRSLDRDYICTALGDAPFCVRTEDCVASTNAELLALAAKGESELSVLIAASQTQGRGRLGRTFFSPEGGVYFSVLFRKTPGTPQDATLLTALAGLCVAQTAECLGVQGVGIKWVNDVYRDDKKCCGILTQGVFTNGLLDYAVCGIGLNVFPPKDGFGESLPHAGSFFSSERDHLREDFVVKVLLQLKKHLPTLADRSFLPHYRARLCMLGKEVLVHTPSQSYPALAEEIDDDCRLWVRRRDGEAVLLSSEEVSLSL